MNRGCANRGENNVKFLQYFDNHDVNDSVCTIASKLVDQVENKIEELNKLLIDVGYFDEFEFKLDRNEGVFFTGWVKFKNKEESAKIRVLVDDCDEFYFDANLNRPKLLALSGGSFGDYGFNFKLPQKPKKKVIITVVGNSSAPLYSADVS